VVVAASAAMQLQLLLQTQGSALPSAHASAQPPIHSATPGARQPWAKGSSARADSSSA
jgi:hypothetical protein